MSTTRHLVNRRRRLAAQPRPAPRGPAADRAEQGIQEAEEAREAEVQDAVPPRRAARPRPAGARPRARTGGKRIAASGAPPRDSAEGPAGSTARRLPAPLARRLLRGRAPGTACCCAVPCSPWCWAGSRGGRRPRRGRCGTRPPPVTPHSPTRPAPARSRGRSPARSTPSSPTTTPPRAGPSARRSGCSPGGPSPSTGSCSPPSGGRAANSGSC
ncbi:hypothetical protein ACWV95_32485 [Streptomyces albus]